VGCLWAAALGVAALEVTGMCADQPPRARRGPEWRKQMLWYLGRRLGCLVLAISCVATSTGILSFLAWRTQTLWECKPSVGCALIVLLGIIGFIFLVAFVLTSLTIGSVTLRPGLADAVSPTSWWMGLAGVARVIALAALTEVFPTAVDGFFHTSDWAVMVAVLLVTTIATGRVVLAVFWWRRSSWPLPCLAISVVWGVRLSLELLGHMHIREPKGLRQVLVFSAYVAAALLAGTASLRMLWTTVPQMRARLRWSARKTWCRVLVRIAVAALFILAGLRLEQWRTDPHARFVERLAACGVMSTVTAGCIALQLLPDGNHAAPTNGAPGEAPAGAARV